VLEAFDEHLHPRGRGGKWIHGLSAGEHQHLQRSLHAEGHYDLHDRVAQGHDLTGADRARAAEAVRRGLGQHLDPSHPSHSLMKKLDPTHGTSPGQHDAHIPGHDLYGNSAPTPTQNAEFDQLVSRLGDDAMKAQLGLDRTKGYSDLVYAFDALSPAAAEKVLGKLRGRRSVAEAVHEAAGLSFNQMHPRGRGGQWTAKSGSSGSEVQGIQNQVGATADGKYGEKTTKAVRQFQRSNGLHVDGVVGRQTVAAMRGKSNASKVKVGGMTAADRRWLAKHAAG
jgi:murein L,D-transpeptidase YcbB/YkuD